MARQPPLARYAAYFRVRTVKAFCTRCQTTYKCSLRGKLHWNGRRCLRLRATLPEQVKIFAVTHMAGAGDGFDARSVRPLKSTFEIGSAELRIRCSYEIISDSYVVLHSENSLLLNRVRVVLICGVMHEDGCRLCYRTEKLAAPATPQQTRPTYSEVVGLMAPLLHTCCGAWLIPPRIWLTRFLWGAPKIRVRILYQASSMPSA